MLPDTVAKIILRILDIIHLELSNRPPEEWARTWEVRADLLEFWMDVGRRLGGVFTPNTTEKEAVTP